MYNADVEYLKSKMRMGAGKDILESWDLLMAAFQSAVVVDILRSWCSQTLPEICDRLSCDISLVAFGSLGRLEFVYPHSDLDPLIVLSPRRGAALPNADEVRFEVLGAVVRQQWLRLDHKDEILNRAWLQDTRPDIPFPVLSEDALLTGATDLDQIRRLQVLLESRCLFGDDLYGSVYARLMAEHGRLEGPEQDYHFNWSNLLKSTNTLYAAFGNPAYLYRNGFKFWKTVLLREYFTFSTILYFVLGYSLQAEADDKSLREEFHRGTVTASTTVKVLKALRFAEFLRKRVADSAKDDNVHAKRLRRILKGRNVTITPFMFGSHEKSTSVRLLIELVFRLLLEYAKCWRIIYDPRPRAVLENTPTDNANPDWLFQQEIRDPNARECMRSLQTARNTYLRLMGALAEVIDTTFIKGPVVRATEYDDDVTKALTIYMNL